MLKSSFDELESVQYCANCFYLTTKLKLFNVILIIFNFLVFLFMSTQTKILILSICLHLHASAGFVICEQAALAFWCFFCFLFGVFWGCFFGGGGGFNAYIIIKAHFFKKLQSCRLFCLLKSRRLIHLDNILLVDDQCL